MSTADLQARSPWSSLTHTQAIDLFPLRDAPDADLMVPGSKSVTNRALMLAGLAVGTSTLRGVLQSDDSYWCIQCLNSLGATTTLVDGVLTVNGCGGRWPIREGILYAGAAGTVARFLPGALAGDDGGAWELRGSHRLQERPIAPLIDALRGLGANITYLQKDGCLPIRIEGMAMAGGHVEVSGKVSSQFLSGVLIASPYAHGPVTLTVPDHIVQHAYVQITIDMMKKFGVQVNAAEDFASISVSPQRYESQDLVLEADASSSCYLLALAALTGGRIRVLNVGSSTLQPDLQFVRVLEKMGCTVYLTAETVEVRGPVRGQLKGGFSISMREMSDQTLTLAALSVFADAPICISEVEHIRHHECDRLSAIAKELRQLGIQVEERHDGVTVYPGLPTPASVDSHDDHRVAMSLALIGVRSEGIRVTNPGCVSKTFPSYFEILQRLGVGMQEVGC